jgi:uncharacterized membrane protein
MALQEQNHAQGGVLMERQHGARRRFLLAAIAAAVFLMSFYVLTGGDYVHQDPLLAAGDWAGYALCHRITERSFMVNGRQLPLCARCTGMYLGAALTVLALFTAGRSRWTLLPRRKILVALLGLIVLMGIDGINSYSHFFPQAPHLYEPRNWLRLATGMGAGLALGTIVMAALAQALWHRPRFSPLIADGREFAGLILLGIVAAVLVLSNQPALLYVLTLVSTGGLLFVVTALNTAVLLVLSRRDGRAESWAAVLRPLSAGFLLAVLELSAISAVRLSVTGTMTGIPGL